MSSRTETPSRRRLGPRRLPLVRRLDVGVVAAARIDEGRRAVVDEAAPLGLGVDVPQREAGERDRRDDRRRHVPVVHALAQPLVAVLVEDDPADLAEDDDEERHARREAAIREPPVRLAPGVPEARERHGSVDAVVLHHGHEQHRAVEHGEEHEADDRAGGGAVETEKSKVERVRKLDLDHDDHREARDERRQMPRAWACQSHFILSGSARFYSARRPTKGAVWWPRDGTTARDARDGFELLGLLVDGAPRVVDLAPLVVDGALHHVFLPTFDFPRDVGALDEQLRHAPELHCLAEHHLGAVGVWVLVVGAATRDLHHR
mmetsp:Transcript_10698/g.43278  ORF Transcript_10698/g.43278 Transcript_10698/m.43278 type:complete len:319 (+) Transcript_10698:274-1230(+)